ncbi:Probable LRR receptor-like serine/threonine-protein kinase At1g74360 [Linum perenne]
MTRQKVLCRRNRVNHGRYLQWNQSNHCNWSGISCSSDGSRVIGIDLADDNISGELYGNFSSLTALEFLDLSRNSLLGSLPADLSNCQTLAAGSLQPSRSLLFLTRQKVLCRRNRVNHGRYLQWNQSNHCNWPGISCSSDGSRVIGIDLADDNISGELYGNFSSLTALEFLDLSRNSLLGSLPADLSNCQTLAAGSLQVRSWK